MTEIEKKEVGKRLAEVAKGQFGGKGKLAEALGLIPSSLSEYFSGKTIPGRIMCDKLESVGVDTNYILYGVHNPNRRNLQNHQNIEEIKEKPEFKLPDIKTLSINQMDELSKQLKEYINKIDSILEIAKED